MECIIILLQGRVDQFKQLRGLGNVATNDIVNLEDD